jgi:type IV secretion system protein TrbL
VKNRLFWFFAIFAIFVLICNPLHAQAMDPKVTTENLLQYFKDNMTSWEPVLRGYAIRIFWLLAGIEFTWTAIKLAFKGADLSEFLAELVSQIIYIGFYYLLLTQSSQWAGYIISSLKTAAFNASSSPPPSPSDILEIAIGIVTKTMTWTFSMNVQALAIAALSAIAILLVGALMTANMFEALIESYFVISAGVILMGFGGSRWTNEYAKKVPIYALSVGMKIFVLQLIMGLAQTVLQDLFRQYDPSNIQDTLVMVGTAIILWIISLNVPNKLQGLINGTSFGTGGIIAGAVASAATIGAQVAIAAATGGNSTAAGGVGAAKSFADQSSHDEEPPPLPPNFPNSNPYGFDTTPQRRHYEGETGIYASSDK